MSLADLDERLLARAAERLGGILAARDRRVARPHPVSDGERSRVPLGVLRDVPQLAFVLVALLFLGAAGVVLAQSRQNASQRPGVQSAPVAPREGLVATLGPDVGATVATYLGTAREGLTRAGATSPASVRTALVSLSAYATPAQVIALFGAIPVVRVYLRARSAGVEALQLPVEITDLRADLTRGYAMAAQNRLRQRTEYEGYIATINGATEDQRAQKALFVSLARAAGVEGGAYSSGCACVFAVVATAPVRDLLALGARPGIRAVQVAEDGVTVGSARIVPLLPEVTTVVPQRKAAP